MKKYGRTYHFSFSLEIHSDDKTLAKEIEENGFINKRIIITEKLDGENSALAKGVVFARSHSFAATHVSFSMVKRINQFLIGMNILDKEEYLVEKERGFLLELLIIFQIIIFRKVLLNS